MNTGDWVLVRVDASATMGTGHWMRCLTLADAFRRHSIDAVFLFAEAMPTLLNKTVSAGYQCEHIHPGDTYTIAENRYSHSNWLGHSEQADAETCVHWVEQLAYERGGAPGGIIVDHYALAGPWETVMVKQAPVLALDDLADRPHSAQWVLDQTYGRTAGDYRDWVSEDTRCLMGSEYALIRPEFGQYRAQSLARRSQMRDPPHLLVTLGGVDNDQRCLSVMNAVWPLRHRIQCTVLTGRDHPDWVALNAWRDHYWPALSLQPFVDRVAELFSQVDLCIGAAGSTSWERCVMGVPTIVLQLAANQATVAQQLDKAGAAIDFGFWSGRQSETLCTLVETLIEDPDRLREMSVSASRVCDGYGTDRVIANVLESWNHGKRSNAVAPG